MSETAITKKEGPCIVFAGAGTGKTYTIIEKLKYLIQNNIYEPEKIVCLTFSNEAANTLKERITKHVTGEPLIKTFHSFCADILKQYGRPVGVAENFRILVPDEAKIMLHKNLKVHPMMCSKYIETIGVAKDLGITIDSITAYIEKEKKANYCDDLQKSVEMAQFELNTRHALKKKYGRGELESRRDRLKHLTSLLKLQKFTRTWNAYEKLKEKRNMLDYADLHTKTIQLFEKEPQRAHYYSYVIVDEFQDTNKMQFDLIVLLAPHKNVTVVGDLNQSIYRFRGAYRENITKFKEVFKAQSSDIFALEKSFRSPNTVLRLAQKLLEKEQYQFTIKNAYDKEGEKITITELKNDKEETRKVLELLEEEIARGTPLEEICVIFRTHSQTQRLKRVCEEKKIPFSASTRGSLLARPCIQMIVNTLSIANAMSTKKKGGESHWWSLFNIKAMPREDLALVGKEIKKMAEESLPVEQFLENIEKRKLSEKGHILMAEVKKELECIKKEIEEKKSPLDLLESIWNMCKEKWADEEKNYIRLKEWVDSYIKTESPELGDILYHLEIMDKLGILLDPALEEKRGIQIMTNHATKGLEYDVVIITNLAEGRFPSERARSNELLPSALMPDIAEKLKDVPDYAQDEVVESLEKSTLLAEERRLAYVACTRAKKRLYMTYAKEYGSRKHNPSIFLKELDYTKNPDVAFVQDDEEKTQIIVPDIVSADKMVKKEKRRSFSPSALLLFDECQKKYEYKYHYGMPEKEPLSWEEIRLGSFVHELMEQGVKANFTHEEQFLELARTKYTQEPWNQVNLEDALAILRVFYQRNKKKYSPVSRTEQRLHVELEGIAFEGYADRIDVHPEGIEIIDYKTGKAFVSARHRNWQLGLYALAAAELGLGPVRKMTLDMLRQEKPLEFELDENGIARDINAPRTSFNLYDIKQELVKTAQTILKCQEEGFAPCDLEKGCEFCNEFIWKI